MNSISLSRQRAIGMADDRRFQYYESQDGLPTFGDLNSFAEFEDYAAHRREYMALPAHFLVSCKRFEASRVES